VFDAFLQNLPKRGNRNAGSGSPTAIPEQTTHAKKETTRRVNFSHSFVNAGLRAVGQGL